MLPNLSLLMSKDAKAVPWKYDVDVQLNDGMTKLEKEDSHDGVGGITHSGRIYTPEEIRKE